MTENGTLVVVEVEGDDRDNSDSECKLWLGRKWAERAGEYFRYMLLHSKNTQKNKILYFLRISRPYSDS